MSQHEFVMDYIEDKAVLKAVMFACSLLKKGKNYSSAVRIASRYYDVDAGDVRHYLSQRSGRSQANRNQ